MSDLIIFDLDGVITSEDAYWDAAGLTLHEFLCSPRYWGLGHQVQYQPAATAEESRRISRATYPDADIQSCKARAINSNWDTCYTAVCLHCIHLLALLPTLADLLPLKPWDAAWTGAFRESLAELKKHMDGADEEMNQHLLLNALRLRLPTCDTCIGLELINCLDSYSSELLGHAINGAFSRYSPFWRFCQHIFQEWYLGDTLYTKTYGHAPKQPGKPGCIHFEQPLLATEQIKATLERLHEEGYTLGFATGRPRTEAELPLKLHGLLSFFAEQHRSTYDDVENVESRLRKVDDQTLLSKPHPFQYMLAADRHNVFEQMGTNAVATVPFIVVGDSTSDILSGRAAGAITVAVLTGARTVEARYLLEQSKPDFTIDDMTRLPQFLQHVDSLSTIQQLQFSEREKAEQLLRLWFARHMHIAADSISLSPKATSLNSFNGVYRDSNGEYFFKTHVEEQGILEEYYHAELLSSAGYNIVKPLRTLHEKGQQMVIYPVVRWPVMFDLIRAVEAGEAELGMLETLVTAERRECERLLAIYAETLASSSANEHAQAPIHQLFWHRLTGGRLASFYAEKLVPLSHNTEHAINFEDLAHYHWVINGIPQLYTLEQLIEQAKIVLNPARAGMTIIGHGDAHFGNVFLEGVQERGKPSPYLDQGHGRETPSGSPAYLYFDPAFAGRHSPLFDVIKPLFHNIFATWMYFPHDVARELHLKVYYAGSNIVVEHNYGLTRARQQILQTKVQYLLQPLVAWLRAQKALPDDWQEMMRLALMCCPLLTINLLEREHIPVPIIWLGLALSVQMGNNGIEPWRKLL